MKNLLKSVIIVVAIILGLSIQAQTKSPKLENSLLWEISGNGLSKPSYLYGTIHMICGSDYFLSDKTKKAFEASEKLVLEIDMSDPKEMNDMQQMAMGKEPLSKTLSAPDLLKLDNILQKKTGMSIQQVDSYSLFTIMSLVMVKSFGCNDLKFYEMNFIETAKQRNLPIMGLETVKEQMNMFENAYSDTEMIQMLEEFSKEETDKLVAKYKEENINSLYDMITDEKMITEETKKAILDNRNQNWLKTIPAVIKKESTFIAVGSAHLASDLGLINLLRKAGYTVKPVMN
ncbi:TraB/GumN family protein [Flavobacterium fluviatile]|uniref:TraB/GumN family protein n=1 Tax=Flavobacterium fluviatile TaxID=1862387 RepID=UPI0013D1FB14|nr:TraB/GumN family protein [Flavobacterium fluviatile]